ncbi:hypothetical protein [Kutzneria sp. CA-103260]|uniref:hypothetical protein n=1 Tax=Kutzneria sp. CA-103260 TaxID=2802641 RepID=UPI001BA65214|nr:hypothetical protein [Kutzneria sp. CA-103260]
MAHRLSLVRRLGELRRLYTAETDSTLWPAVTTGIASLTDQSRTTIRDVLDTGFETRLLGENSLPPVDDRMRCAVLSDATDPAQQQLEAAVLFALGRTAPYRWPATSVVAPMPVCTMVHPDIKDMRTVLHLRPAAAAPMLAELLPHAVNGRVHGMPGLRVSLRRRHVRLCLADSGESVSVALAGTSFRQWSAMLAFAGVLTGHEWPPVFEDPLSAPERGAIAAGCVPGPAWLASALFRRLRVLGTTVWLTVREDGPTCIRVEWCGGRTAAQVATALVHPLAGLPGDVFTATRDGADSVTVTIEGAADWAAATVILRRASLSASPPFDRIDTVDAWKAFKLVMAQPHLVSPKPAA